MIVNRVEPLVKIQGAVGKNTLEIIKSVIRAPDRVFQDLARHTCSSRHRRHSEHNRDTAVASIKMPSAASPNPPIGSSGANDNRPSYDQDVDDFLRDLPIDGNTNRNEAQPSKDVDEEVKVKKKRAPVPKLDEGRLLSDAGVTKLRKNAKNLRFKGKGHEFTDISRLLNMYQLWLDDLYPRAKFRDALTMVEKVGHSKRMQITRRAWMDDTKPNRREKSPERVGDVEMSGALHGAGQVGSGQDQSADDDVFGEGWNCEQPQSNARSVNEQNDVPEEGDLDALMAENSNSAQVKQAGKSLPPAVRRGPFQEDDDGPDDDELEALLAESNVSASGPSGDQTQKQDHQQRRAPFEEDDDDNADNLDALMAEESTTGKDLGTFHANRETKTTSKSGTREADDFADEEEAMASMGGMW